MSKPKILFYPAGYSGCAWWRIRNPVEALRRNYNDFEYIVIDHSMSREHVTNLCLEANLAILQSPGSIEGRMTIENHLLNVYLHGSKVSDAVPVLIDYDDYSFDLSPVNPRYKDLGTKEVILKDKNGKEKWLWKNGHMGFDLQSNIARYGQFCRCVWQASGVTTTTEYLAGKFQRFNPNVFVLPNSIDFSKWGAIPRPDKTKNEIRIGWFGGDSHLNDLLAIKDIFQLIINKYNNVKLVFIMPTPWPVLDGLPRERVEVYPWTSLELYPLFLASMHWDIGLVPLSTQESDIEFNMCKSNIKWLEFASMGVPAVMTDIIPHANTVEHGSNGILVRNEGFLEAVCELIEDANKRIKIGQNAYQTCRESYDLDKNCKIWYDLYTKMLDTKKTFWSTQCENDLMMPLRNAEKSSALMLQT